VLSVLIADDHEVVRRGLKEILQGEFTELCIGEAQDAQELQERLEERSWTLVLLDVLIPGVNVLEAVSRIHKLDPPTRVLIVTSISESEYAGSLLRAGADGYITKQRACDELIAAVHKVLEGGVYLTDAGIRLLATGRPAQAAAHERLSARELQVLRLLARGRSVKEIAQELSVSDKTVATYVARIREKTGLQNYVEMTRYALQHKSVD
jgi:two-component system, NarL family, invasion response regulator UvrY